VTAAEWQSAPAAKAAILEVSDLRVEFDTARGIVRPVDGVSWSVRPGEIVALVGESGCGKSVSALAIMRLLGRPAGRIAGGRVVFDGADLLSLSEDAMRSRRGKALSMIFQEPMSSLNPLMTIGEQLMEPLRLHLGLSESVARARARDLLEKVGITDSERRLGQYPHHLSGGMRQRVMIAIGIACQPKLIIADEPTTALDVTIQAQILELLRSLSREMGIALVIITHNLGIVARYADRVNVMYAGRVVESGTVDSIFAQPSHPYTVGLLTSVPRLDQSRRARLATIEGSPPDMLHPPRGCRFAPRCAHRIESCEGAPDLRPTNTGTTAACHRSHEIEHLRGTTPAEPLPMPGAREMRSDEVLGRGQGGIRPCGERCVVRSPRGRNARPRR
jgi:peptide/nickel transport system ATP-binding protein